MATTPKAASSNTSAAKKSPRKRTPRSTLPPKPQYTEAQRHAMFEAYQALQLADLPIPVDLKEVEHWIAEAQERVKHEQELHQRDIEQQAEEIIQANQNGPWYVRNCYPAPFNLRLDRQTERRRIELKPRGTPGDLHPLKEDDMNDSVLKHNLALGVIEIIPAGEATLVMEKQTHNMSHRVHTPIATLRNELGDTYNQGSVKVEAEFNSQGVTVAQVDQRVLTGELHDREIGGTRGTGGLTRVGPNAQPGAPQQSQSQQATSVMRSGFVPTGGNPAIIQYGPTDNSRAQIVDDLARRRGLEGPGAGLGNVQVVVEPVQRT